MFSVRKYSYEDLDEDVLIRSDRSRTWNLLHLILIVLIAFGAALFFLVLLFTFYSVRHHVHSVYDDEVVLAATPSPLTEPVIVNLAKGSIEGKRMNTREGREFLAFLGIPYAKPPLGNLRFQPPVEEESWNGTLITKEFQSRCIQKKSSRDSSNSTAPTIGSEDCLYLNVFTPKTLEELKGGQSKSRSRLPVMLYIHNGIGGAMGHVERNGGEYLLDEDVILVAHHYRLGVIGNLNTMDRNARGNQGQKDTVMVLKWIKNNIEKFGGDPSKVTMFGESYGAMSTSAHLISPMSKGLFHRAICQSGTILYPGLLARNTLKKAHILGSKLNCSDPDTTITSEELFACLQNSDAAELVMQSLEAPLGQMEFTVSVEPDIGSSENDVFLPDSPLNLYLNGSSFNSMPVILGTTSAEMLFQSLIILSDRNLTEAQNRDWKQLLVEELLLDIASEEPEKLAIAIHDFYLGSAKFSRDTERNSTFMFTDRSYTHSTSVSANYQLQANKAAGGGRLVQNSDNVYLYQFNYPVNTSLLQPVIDMYNSSNFLGVSHADELQFFFPYKPFPLIPVEHEDYNFSRFMIHMWTSFADTGVPDATAWTPISGTKPDSWFRIEKESRMISTEDGLSDRIQFWNSLNLTELYL